MEGVVKYKLTQENLVVDPESGEVIGFYCENWSAVAEYHPDGLLLC